MRRFARLVAHDVHGGICEAWRYYAGVAVLALCLSIVFVAAWRARQAGVGSAVALPAGACAETGPTFGDLVAYVLAGKAEYHFDPFVGVTNAFQVPWAWMFILMLMMAGTLWYPYRDLTGSGRAYVLAAGGRLPWWFSKCVWVVAATCCYWLVVALVLGLVSLVADFAWAPSLTAVGVALLEPAAAAQETPSVLWLVLLVLPVSSALALTQLVLSLVVSPLVAYAAVAAALFVSSFFASPWLLGNHLMAARSDGIVQGGVDTTAGLVLAALLCVAAVSVGAVIFCRMDILDKEYV